MNELNRCRQHGIFRMEQALSDVTIIGLGGIGSPVVLGMAKMGARRILGYDFDSVEDHNLPNQFFRHKDKKHPKGEALAEMVREFADGQFESIVERYVDQELAGVVIVAVDDIDIRRDIWPCIKFNPNVDLMIDARMGGEVAVIYSIRPCDPDDIKIYEASLFKKENATQLPCTERAIFDNALGIASTVCRAVRHWWVKGEIKPIRRLDFGSETFM